MDDKNTVAQVKHYTQYDEHGTAQIFYINVPHTHRQTYQQKDILTYPRILISSHSCCPMLIILRVNMQSAIIFEIVNVHLLSAKQETFQIN